MPRGQHTVGHDGEVYDSIQEAEVSRLLKVMMDEKIIKNFLVHPNGYGLKNDFIVQMAPMGVTLGKGNVSNQLVFIEYDGLAEDRTRDIYAKLDRHAHMRQDGFDARWLLEATYEAVRECLLDYKEPPFIKKYMTCKCGKEKSIYVFVKRAVNLDKEFIEGTYTCYECGGH
jgi:hypothetical protein